jgi:ribonucleoside-triphosphate reductase
MEGSVCKRETEVYSRVVGFYRPTKLWNRGKKEEFKERKEFSLDKMEKQTASFSAQEVKIG